MAGGASGSDGRQPNCDGCVRRLAHDHARLPAVADGGRSRELELIGVPSAGTSQSGPAVTALGMMVARRAAGAPGGFP